jgi:hypothetical protein
MPITPNDPDYKRIMQAHRNTANKERKETLERDKRIREVPKRPKKF